MHPGSARPGTEGMARRASSSDGGGSNEDDGGKRARPAYFCSAPSALDPRGWAEARGGAPGATPPLLERPNGKLELREAAHEANEMFAYWSVVSNPSSSCSVATQKTNFPRPLTEPCDGCAHAHNNSSALLGSLESSGLFPLNLETNTGNLGVVYTSSP